MGLIHIGFSICIILSVAYKVDCYKDDVPTKRFFSSYYHNLKPIRPGKVAWKWSSENRFNPKENSKKNNPPIFKSEEAVNQLLALSEDEMIEKLFRMEMNQAVSLAQDIIFDLRQLLKQVRSTENQLRPQQGMLENTLQQALDPSDPGRLLRLS